MLILIIIIINSFVYRKKKKQIEKGKKIENSVWVFFYFKILNFFYGISGLICKV